MAYTKTTWQDRVVQNPNTYNLQSNADGTTTLLPAEGTITTSGTAITAATLNNLETQYDNAISDLENGGVLTSLKTKKNTLDDGNGNLFTSSSITASGFTTASTSTTYAGQWIRIGTITITSQFSEAEAWATVIGSGSAGSSSSFRFYWRVKQQGSMGSAPIIELTMFDQNGTNNTNLVAVTTTNSTSQTIVDLYVKMPFEYETYYINPFQVVSPTSFTWQTGQSFVTSLPTGTQTVSSYLGNVDITAFGSSFGGNGYQKLPSGLIIQWGNATVPSGSMTSFNLPIAFPNNFFQAAPSLINAASFASWNATSKTQIGLYQSTGANAAVSYIAVGN